MSENAAIELDNVSFCYGKRAILQNVSLHVRFSESVAIVGRSGSGKSTLLSIISGLITPTCGTVRVNGRDLSRASQHELANIRRDSMGFVFQDGELLPALSAVENVSIPALLSGSSWESADQRARDLLTTFEVFTQDQPSAVLSGGERQRTAIARALMNNPRVIVADEPTGALDTELRDDVADLLFSMPQQSEQALLIVTHDPSTADRADSIYRLDNGTLRPEATREAARS